MNYDINPVAANTPVTGPVTQWYGPSAVPGTALQQRAIPAVVASTPRTAAMGAAAAPPDADSAQASPVYDANIVTTPLEPSTQRLRRETR